MQKEITKRLAFSAVMIALASVLSLIKIWEMPLGGSITLLSMLPIVILSVKYGTKWGLCTAFIYSVVQILLGLYELMSWGLTPAMWVGSLLFDYIIAFSAIGLSGLFRKKGVTGICLGTALALSLRFISHFISGVIFFGIWCPEGWNTAVYSICYNGAFMLPEIIFTVAAAAILFKLPQIKNILIGNQH